MVATSGPGWELAPSLKAAYVELDALYPNRPTASDGTIGDDDHQARDSDHNPHVLYNGKYYVTAGDFTDWDPTFDVDAWGEQLRQRRDQRVKYWIGDGRFFSSYATTYRKAWEWAKYDGPNGHFKHGHLSVLPTSFGLFNTDSWFSEDEVTDADLQKIDDLIDRKLAAFAKRFFGAAIGEGQTTWAGTVKATLTAAQKAATEAAAANAKLH